VRGWPWWNCWLFSQSSRRLWHLKKNYIACFNGNHNHDWRLVPSAW
jgi:hypothetical protein